MVQTIIGYFEQVSEAQRVLQDLIEHGFDRDRISLIGHQEHSGLEQGGIWTPHLISVPGVGPVLAAGPLAAGLSNTTGDPSGSSLLAVLKGSGAPADDAEWYLEALRRGGVLIAVETSDADAGRVADLMNRVRQSAKQARERADTAAEVSPTGEDTEALERSIDLNVPVSKAFVEGHGRASAEPRPSTAAAQRTPTRATPTTPTAADMDRRFEDVEADFQRHHHSARPRPDSYAQYAPAYRYGYGLATEPRYAGRDWPLIEAEARRQWEASHHGTWEQFKDAVFYGWGYARGRRHAEPGDVRIPIVEEALRVETRQVERGGVRIYSRVTEQPVEREVQLRDERVTVERRPVDRPATERDLAAFQEGAVELTETREEAIVTKQARVVEEVVIGKDVREHTETVRDTVRRTEVDVEPIGKESAPRDPDYVAYERAFRSHYDTAFASRGTPYEHWAPAYRYGYDLATNARYQDREWAAIEPDARREWEQRRTGTWEEFKEAIRHAWDQIRGRRSVGSRATRSNDQH